MTKRKKVLIIIAIVAVAIIIFAFIFRDQLFMRMPAFYIGNQLEKDVPIGTSAEDVIEYVKSHEEWTNREYEPVNYLELDEFGLMYNGSSAMYPRNSYSLYSFSGIDYKGNPDESFGSYTLYVDFGEMSPIPIAATWVNVFFVFNEDQKLIDIVVSKEHVGP